MQLMQVMVKTMLPSFMLVIIIVMFLLTTIIIVLLMMLLLHCYSPASRPFSPQLLPDFLYWHYSPAMFYSDGFEEGLAIISKVDPSSPLSRPCCDEL